MTKPAAILFDLDGTLLDTIHDFLLIINELKHKQQQAPITADLIRHHANHGSNAMLSAAFNLNQDHPELTLLRQAFLERYQIVLGNRTDYFPKVPELINQLNQSQIPWGIVTNKPSRFAIPLIKQMSDLRQIGCLVCGDTIDKAKPHPDPILYACKLLQADPAKSIYVGDAPTDVIASKSAGLNSVVALYGYIEKNVNPYEWQADAYISEPMGLLKSIDSLSTFFLATD